MSSLTSAVDSRHPFHALATEAKRRSAWSNRPPWSCLASAVNGSSRSMKKSTIPALE